MKTSIFFSQNPETTAFGRVAPESQDAAIVHVAVRNPSNYRHVLTCRDGGLQDLWELLQPTVSALTHRLYLRGLQIGDIAVTEDQVVHIATPNGFVALDEAKGSIFLGMSRDVPTFSVPSDKTLPPTTVPS